MDTRGDLDVETLLKVVLVLVVIWIGVEVLDTLVDVVLGPLDSVFGLLVVVLILLWLFDRI